jgi:type I restriction enzyme S subunit
VSDSSPDGERAIRFSERFKMTGFQTTLGEICTLRRGVSYTGANLCEDGNPMLNLKSFSKEGEYRPEGIKFYNGKFKSTDLINQDEIVVANTDLTKEGDILGASIMIPADLVGRDVIGSHHTTILTVNDSRVNPRFLCFVLNTPKVRLEVRRFRRGATVKGIVANDLRRIPLTIPTLEEQLETVKLLEKLLFGVDSSREVTERYILAFQALAQTRLE